MKQQLRDVLAEPSVVDMIARAVGAHVVDQLKGEIMSLKQTVAKKDGEIKELHDKLDNLEQYTRCNSVRIGPVPERLNENTDNIVIKLAESVAVQLNVSDIDRSHRVGKITEGPNQRPRSIIVKFSTYRAKQSLMKARKGLNKTDVTKTLGDQGWPRLPSASPRVFINDDLTASRASVAAKARQLKRDEKIQDTWVRDGLVFIKHRDKIYRFTRLSELSPFSV
ncbi:hypothetical protein V1264_013413 [Littorina saxatilis]|uniref:Uncharacterized protein n=1 Tax=Littorina saxatilis TaxID=31220 RepID=A0AAN9BPZ1_9CAEN